MQNLDKYNLIKDYALRLLSRFPKTVNQLRQKLKQKFPEEKKEIIDAVVIKLKEIGVIDDKQFSLSYSKSMLKVKSKSPFEVKMKLKAKGIATETIEETLQSLLQETDLEEIATKAASKKLSGLNKYKAEEKRQKLYAFLHRKAFPAGIIKKVTDSLLK